MPNSKTICLTGAHHTPAIELIRQLRSSPDTKWHIDYISHRYKTETHLANTIIPQLKINLHLIHCNKFDRQKPLLSILKLPLLFAGIIESLIILNKIKPDITVSFGGYVSVPVVIASWLLKIPSLTHEQTLTISLATRINSIFSQKVALSFPCHHRLLPATKTIVTGNLLRQEIFATTSKKYRHLTKLIRHQPLIYITGGNQGSQFLNQLTASLLPHLNRFTIIHQTGRQPTTITHDSPNYHPTEYVSLSDIGWVFHHSSLIISRAGANICQEIASLKRKSIIIPHPKTQQNEQIKNAAWLKSQLPKLTTVIPQSQATTLRLIQLINHQRYLSTPPPIRPTPTPHPLIKLINTLTKAS